MRRFTTTLLAVAVLVAGCSQTSTDGAVLYGRFCGACHGGDLSGGVGPALGAGSALAAATDADYRRVIIEGIGDMPANRSLDDEQLNAVIAYIRRVPGQ